MSTASADGVLYNTSDGNLASALAPDNLAKIKALQAANAFSGGLPKDANGQPDYSAMAATLMQKGDFADANNLTQTGLSQQKIRMGFAAANDLANGLQPASGAGGAAPAAGGAMPVFQNAIKSVESSGNYGAQGPVTKSGDRAYGAYQIMGANIPAWTKEILGSELTPAQFLANPEAQNSVFNGKFGQYLQKYGNPRDAASMWFSGRPLAQGGSAQDQLGTTGSSYVDKFMAALPRGKAPATASVPPTAPVQVAQNATTTQSDAPAVGSQHPYAPTPAATPAPTATADASPTPVAAPAGAPAPSPAVATTGDAPQSAVDPTLGGLLRGQWVNNPGGYMTALRARAVALAASGNDAAAGAYNQQATMVENALTRSETPEVKNYAVALRQGYRGTMMDFASDKAAQVKTAELAAEGAPNVIRAKGQAAEATAAGTEQGKAPYDLVPTQPTPGGPTVLVPKAQILAANGAPAVKSQPAFYGQQQEALGKQQTEMLGQYQQRQVAKERLDAMSNLLETFQSGANADVKAAALASARSLGFQIPDSATANPEAVEQFSKNATANIFAQAKSLGGKVLVSELDGLKKSNANPNMQPASNAAIIAQQRGLLDWQDAHDQAFFAWHQANPNAYDPSSFEQQWAQSNPPSKYVAAAKMNIAPLGVPIPPKAQLVDGQAYMIKGQKARWSASANGFVPVKAAP